MATNAPYLELARNYQDQVLNLIEHSQKLAVAGVSAWARAVQPLATAAPTPPLDGAPSPKDLVDVTYGFASKLVDAQHGYACAVLDAAEPAAPRTVSGNGPKAAAGSGK